MEKRNLNFEDVILKLVKLIKSGKKEVARESMKRMSELGQIDERSVAIVDAEIALDESKEW